MHKVSSGVVCLANDYAVYDLYFNSSADQSKGTYFMRIVLPTVDESRPMEKRMELLNSVEKQLTSNFTKDCQMHYYDEVNVSLPKFRLAPSAISIVKELKGFGMNRAFEDNAEFFEMVNQNQNSTDESNLLKIADIFHEAFVEIDENGAEAAAATAVIMDLPQSAPAPIERTRYDFIVDHPFLFQIIEKSTGAAVFMGRVVDLP